MQPLKKLTKLKKELKLIDVYAIATGTTLSAGFFLLPGIAAAIAGPAIVLAYVIAAVPLIPAMFSIIELSTAMPRAGGIYYFLDRTLGPYFGTIGGLGTWLALILKVSFALIGMGAYISLFFPEFEIVPVAIFLAVILGLLNIFGAKKSGGLQILLVIGLLFILILFITGGLPEISLSHFKGFFDSGTSSLLATAGLVYISYVGVTNVASLSEEVDNPEKNLPRGVFLALGTAIIVYILGTAVMVGVIPMEKLAGDLTPVATAAGYFFGKFGSLALSIAALLAFVSVANAGTLSASRYPLAMSRDHLLPGTFRKLGKLGTPVIAIVATVAIIVLILLFLDPTGIAKLASAFQLLMFALVCLAVIVMRESKIGSYDPGYSSPLYPWMQIFGIIAPLILIFEMGHLTILFSLGLIVAGSVWYLYYGRKMVQRTGAVHHVFERLGRQRNENLDTELRGILKEKGLRQGDPFEDIVMRSQIFDIEEEISFEELTEKVSRALEKIIPLTAKEISKNFLDGTRIGLTPVTHGVALPHLRVEGMELAEMVLVRAKNGVNIKVYNPITHEQESESSVNAIFFLVSPEKNPTQHLRILAQIAGRVDEDTFMDEWFEAEDEQQIKEILLHDERFLSLCITSNASTSEFLDKSLKEISLPEGCLVAMLRRSGNVIIPRGDTEFEEGDRLTIIGDTKGLGELIKHYPDGQVG